MRNLIRRCFYLLSLSLAACGPAPETISISGSTTVLPVIVQAAEIYTMKTGQAVIINAGGSGSGFNQLASGQTDIAMMSRDITETERAARPDETYEIITIGRDAVVAAVSSEIYEAGIQSLSLSQISDIYAGRVTNWAELGGPKQDILVIDKEMGRGTRHVFFEVISGDGEVEALGTDLVIGSNNEGQTAITQSDAAIGQLSHSWLNADVRGLTIRLENGTEIAPTLETIQDGAFPITRDLNLILRSDASAASRDFIAFILSESGQDFVSKNGYVALAPPDI